VYLINNKLKTRLLVSRYYCTIVEFDNIIVYCLISKPQKCRKDNLYGRFVYKPTGWNNHSRPLSVCLCLYIQFLSVTLSVCLSKDVSLSLCLSVYSSVSLYLCLTVCMSVSLLINLCLYICLCV